MYQNENGFIWWVCLGYTVSMKIRVVGSYIVGVSVGFLFCASSFAQGPEYTGQIKSESSAKEKRVNDLIIKTNKKIEIEGAQKEVELKKNAPKDLKVDPPSKKKAPFIVNPQAPPQDSRVFRDQYDHGQGADPSTQFEQQVIDDRNTPTEQMTNEEFVRQFKENAAKAGVRVHVDPKTLKARPIKDGSSH